MDDMVTGFPFNLFNNPMYLGSVLNLLATAFWRGSPAGVLLAFWAHLIYTIFVKYFEG
jgi:phosphatidylethanolamine/phosphatidyl-N-methylethanolamine N-methyltransferase